MSEPITDASELGRIAFDAWGPDMAWEAQTPWLRKRYITMAAAVRNAVCPPGSIVVPASNARGAADERVAEASDARDAATPASLPTDATAPPT